MLAFDNWDGNMGGLKRMMIEVADLRANFLTMQNPDLDVVESYGFPFPRKFNRLWSVGGQGTDGAVTAWEPTPPSDRFIALGIVVAKGDGSQPPPLNSIRCVPAHWVEGSTVPPTFVWDDTHLSSVRSGAPVSFWSATSMGLLQAVYNARDDEAPAPERFPQLKRQKFRMNAEDFSSF